MAATSLSVGPVGPGRPPLVASLNLAQPPGLGVDGCVRRVALDETGDGGSGDNDALAHVGDDRQDALVDEAAHGSALIEVLRGNLSDDPSRQVNAYVTDAFVGRPGSNEWWPTKFRWLIEACQRRSERRHPSALTVARHRAPGATRPPIPAPAAAGRATAGTGPPRR